MLAFLFHNEQWREFRYERKLRNLADRYRRLTRQKSSGIQHRQRNTVLTSIIITVLLLLDLTLVSTNILPSLSFFILLALIFSYFLISYLAYSFSTRSLTNRLIKCIDQTEDISEEITNKFKAKTANRLLERFHTPVYESARKEYFTQLRRSAYTTPNTSRS